MDLSTPPESRRNISLGRFRVVSHIATGGMGAVYRAFDPEAGREVALKVLQPDVVAGKPNLVERFRREAQAGARLRHDNLVTLHEFGEAGGTCYLVMELVEGTNLYDYITRHGPLDPEMARQLLIQVSRALDYIHHQGIVHRDIKPANVLLTEKNGHIIAKLSDLGLARQTREEEFRLTREGCTVGTVDYMSPEQARNSELADIRSDLYSLGCTFYHMLTGKPPFSEGSLPERLFKHAEAEPANVRSLNPAVPVPLAAIVRRLLAKKPAERYQTPEELLADLERAAGSGPMSAVSGEVSTETWPSLGEEVAARRGAAAPPGSTAGIVAGQLAYAREQITRGQHDMGLSLLVTCIRLDPGNLESHQALRQALAARGEAGYRPGSLSWLRGQLDRLRLKLARRSGNPAQVLSRGAEVLTRLPDDLPTHLEMAEAADEMDRDELALWLLLEAWKGHEDHPAVNRALARYFEKRKDFDQAVGYWKRVAKADRLDAEAPKKLRDLAAMQAMIRAKKAESKKQ
jgi:hypothetical protein